MDKNPVTLSCDGTIQFLWPSMRLKGGSREEDDLGRRACMHSMGNIARFRSSENDAAADSLLYVGLEGRSLSGWTSEIVK